MLASRTLTAHADIVQKTNLVLVLKNQKVLYLFRFRPLLPTVAKFDPQNVLQTKPTRRP